MSAPAIADLLVRESGRIEKDILKLNFETSVLNDLVVRDTWQDQMGDQLSVITYERNAPSVAVPVWRDWRILDGAEGGACLSPSTKVSFGSTSRTYGLARQDLIGEPFCVENIRFSLALEAQLNAVNEQLAERTKLEWELRNKSEYDRLVKRKVICITTGLVEDNTGLSDFNSGALPTNPPDMLLSQGVLDRMRVKLIRDGAGKNAQGMVDGAPILNLVCDMETSDSILFQDQSRRNDMRWGNPSALLKPYGIEKQYKGFFHIIDEYPRRFSYANSTFTEVPQFVTSQASKGTKADVNPAWEDPATAPYTISRIWHRDVFHQMIPKPITNPGANFRFDPVQYQGQWQFLNIKHLQDNPLGTILVPYGVLAAGSKPVYTNRGVSIMHKRCQAPINPVTACADSNA